MFPGNSLTIPGIYIGRSVVCLWIAYKCFPDTGLSIPDAGVYLKRTDVYFPYAGELLKESGIYFFYPGK